MRFDIHRFYQNREAVIKGTALFLLDVILIIACMVGALWMRFDFSFAKIEPVYWDSVHAYMWINVICTVVINAFCKLYTSLWRFASLEELKNALIAIVLSSSSSACGYWTARCREAISLSISCCCQSASSVRGSRTVSCGSHSTTMR